MCRKNFIFLVCAAAMTLTSCFKNEAQQETYSIDYYIAGNEMWMDDDTQVNIPMIYKTGKVLYRMESDCFVRDVALIGKDVYACGCSVDENHLQHPVYWKNGQIVKLDASELTGAFIQIGTLGEHIYGIGNIVKEDGEHGVIIKNGEIIYTIPTANAVFDAFTLGTGTFYVAGHKDKAGYLWTIVEEDKNYKLYEDRITPKDDNSYSATDIGIYYNRLVAAWNKIDAGTGKIYACYSQSVQFTELGKENSLSTSICAFNNMLYVGGSAQRNDGKYSAYMWMNGMGDEYGKDFKNESAIFKLINDGMFFHILVHETGKMYISFSDMFQAQALDFEVAETFVPEGLYITYTKTSGSSSEIAGTPKSSL